QNNSKVGVGTDRRERRHDGAMNAKADPSALRRERSCSCIRAADKLVHRHTMTVGKSVNIAWLRSIELGEACPSKSRLNPLRTRSHAIAPRKPRAASAATRASAKTEAILTAVTFCRPDQAGMLLTSRTAGRSSVP